MNEQYLCQICKKVKLSNNESYPIGHENTKSIFELKSKKLTEESIKPQVELKEINSNYDCNGEVLWTIEFYIYMLFVLIVVFTVFIIIQNYYYDNYYISYYHSCINNRVIRQL